MKISSTSQTLRLVIESLEHTIKPSLSTDDARASIVVIEKSLQDLLKRQGPSRDYLGLSISQGLALERDILRELGRNQLRSEPRFDEGFDQLVRHHGILSARLASLSTELCSRGNQQSNLLMRRAAIWEHAYYSELPKIEIDSSYKGSKDYVGALSSARSDFEMFFKVQHPDTVVVSFERMIGGHGKQTYFARIENKLTGEHDELVIRKEDTAPLITRGMFKIDAEYYLLTALSKTDFPCPTPQDLFEGDNESGGSFFTMNKLPGSIFSTYLTNGTVRISEGGALQFADLLAKLHSYPMDTFSDYFDHIGHDVSDQSYISVAAVYRHSLDAWNEYMQDVEHLPSPYMAWLFHWLRQNIPDDSRRPVLIHGDFSTHNLLQVDGQITGVLDWECAEFAAPEQDLAYLQPILLQSGVDWSSFITGYVRSGGRPIDESLFPFCQAYAVFKVMLAFNKGTNNLQTGATRDIRLMLVEYEYQSSFMGLGLSCTEPLAPGPESAHGSKLQNRFPHNTSVTTHTELANLRQPTPKVNNWQDSVVLVWWDDVQGVGGFHRLGHESHVDMQGSAVLWTALIGPEGIFKRTQVQSLRDEDLLDGGGYGSGDGRCRVEYSTGKHRWMISEPEEDTKAELVHIDTGPMVDCFPKSGAIGNGFASAHLDIPGVVTGTVTIKGKSYKIDNGLSLRDHAWGVRDWGKSGLSHRWVVGTCGSSFSFVVVSWQNAEHRLAKFGWVIRDQKITLAASVDVLAYVEIDACNNRGGRVQLILETGEIVGISCVPVTKSILNWHRGMGCVDRICKFEAHIGGTLYTGFANFETTSNAQAGNRMPSKIVDGIIDDGYTSLT